MILARGNRIDRNRVGISLPARSVSSSAQSQYIVAQLSVGTFNVSEAKIVAHAQVETLHTVMPSELFSHFFVFSVFLLIVEV